MSQPGTEGFPTHFELPPDDGRAHFLRTYEDTSGNTDELIKAFDETAAHALAAETDPAERHLLGLTIDATRWFHWGRPGDPLPEGLQLTRTTDGSTVVDFAFPLSYTIDQEMRYKLYKHGYGDVIKAIDWARVQSHHKTNAAFQDMLRTSGSVNLLRTIVNGNFKSQEDVEVDHRGIIVRQAIARQIVSKQTGVDVAVMRKAAYESTDPSFSNRARMARREYYRLTDAQDDPVRPTEEQILTHEAYLAARNNLQGWLINTLGNKARQVLSHVDVTARQHGYFASGLQGRIDAVRDLVSEAHNRFNDPFTPPEARRIFLDTCLDLLFTPLRQDGASSINVVSRHPTWEHLIEQSIETASFEARLEYAYACYGLRTRAWDHDRPGTLPDIAPAISTLRAANSTSITNKNPKLYTVDLQDPTHATLEPAYEKPGRDAFLTFYSESATRQMEQVTIATTEFCSNRPIPPDRRILRQLSRREPLELPDHSPEADVAITFSGDGLIKEGYIPDLPGFTLVAHVPSSKRYFFAYNAGKDPYRYDKQFEPERREAIIAATRELGMYGLAVDIERRSRLTLRSLSRLIQQHSYHGYPPEDVLPKGKVLVAQAETLADMKQFIDADGRLSGQCTGGRRLFQLLTIAGESSAYLPQSVSGHAWDPQSGRIDALLHTQSSYCISIDKYAYIDTSLVEGGVFGAPLPPNEIVPMADGKQLPNAMGKTAMQQLLEQLTDEQTSSEQDPLTTMEILIESMQSRLGNKARRPGAFNEELLEKIAKLGEEDPINRTISLVYRTHALYRDKAMGSIEPTKAEETLGELLAEADLLAIHLAAIHDHNKTPNGRQLIKEISRSTGIPYDRYLSAGSLLVMREAVSRIRATF